MKTTPNQPCSVFPAAGGQAEERVQALLQRHVFPKQERVGLAAVFSFPAYPSATASTMSWNSPF